MRRILKLTANKSASTGLQSAIFLYEKTIPISFLMLQIKFSNRIIIQNFTIDCGNKLVCPKRFK